MPRKIGPGLWLTSAGSRVGVIKEFRLPAGNEDSSKWSMLEPGYHTEGANILVFWLLFAFYALIPSYQTLSFWSKPPNVEEDVTLINLVEPFK